MEFNLDFVFYHNPIRSWLTALLVAAAGAVILRFIRNKVASKLADLAQRTANTLDDCLADTVSRTKMIFLLAVTLGAGIQFLTLPAKATTVLNSVIIMVSFVQLAIWGSTLVAFVIRHYVQMEIEDEASRMASATALNFVSRLVVWSLALLLALDNLGVDVTALVASLGVGGIAVALAAQSVLGDMLASLSIMFDKPFIVGDFIIVGDLMGTVERIGLKTTRIRSLHGEQLIFSNNDLLSSRIRNYKRMEERRILFNIGVVYQTPSEKLGRIPQIVGEVIGKEELARFDRAHLKQFGDSALVFEIVYWVKQPDYSVYMDIQQRINLEIIRRFEREKIEFAYPTQTLHLVNDWASSRS